MHVFLGIAIIAGLVAFAFGERAARGFVGILLGLFAAFVVWFVLSVVIETSQLPEPAKAVHMEPRR